VLNGLIKNLMLTGSVLSLLLCVPGCCWSCKKECDAPREERREELVVEVSNNVDAMDNAMGEQEMKEDVK